MWSLWDLEQNWQPLRESGFRPDFVTDSGTKAVLDLSRQTPESSHRKRASQVVQF